MGLGISLDSFDGIGNAWKTPSFTETFELALWSLVRRLRRNLRGPRLAPALPPRSGTLATDLTELPFG